MTIEGTLAALNAALNGLTYELTAKAATITLAYTDLGDNLSATASIAISSSTILGTGGPAVQGASPVSGPTVSVASPDTETASTDDSTQMEGFLAAVEVLAL
jgi:hypothetical protein